MPKQGVKGCSKGLDMRGRSRKLQRFCQAFLTSQVSRVCWIQPLVVWKSILGMFESRIWILDPSLWVAQKNRKQEEASFFLLSKLLQCVYNKLMSLGS